MRILKSKTNQVTLVAVGAFLLALVFVNRWVITDLGLFSFGRVWQYFVSYADFGFARRELWGTVLSLAGVNQIFENAYGFAYVFYVINILIFTGVVWWFLVRYCEKRTFLFYTALFFSPVLILQSAYLTGTQDLQLLLIAFFITLYVRSIALFTVGCFAGVLTHELFVFLLPLLFLAKSFQADSTRPLASLFTPQMLASAVAVLLVIGIVAADGAIDVTESRYDAVMAEKMPAAVGNHPLWSGYFEVSSALEENAGGISTIRKVGENPHYALLPLIYVLLVSWVATYYLRALDHWSRVAFFLAIMVPLLTVFVATDVYRWIGMAGNLGWLLMLVAAGRNQHHAPRWCFVVLTLFVFVAPFGAAEVERPFPAQQLVLEKLGIL